MNNNLTRDEARERAQLLDVVSYDVALDLTSSESFTSTARIVFSAAEGASTFIELIGRPSEVVLNGRSLEGVHDGFRIALDGLAASNVLEVVADCDFSTTGEGLHRFVDPVDGNAYLYTQFEAYEAHRVFACFDQPDLKAPWTLAVRAPEDWVVVSSTSPTQAAGLWEFPASDPISTYLYAVVAGPYQHVHDEHDGLPLGLYCRASLFEHLDAHELFALTRQGLAFYEQLFDRPYPFTKYDQLFVPEFNAGAMENVACVTIAESHVFRSQVTRAARLMRANTVLHELAHMWFGNLVTMRWWDDLWLNEAFATYVAVHAMVEATEFTEGWTFFCDYAKSNAVKQDQLASTHPVYADAVDIRTAESNFDAITYLKGASVLRQLVAWVGEEAFFAGLREYFEEHAWGSTELDDLLVQLEKSSGRDLSGWRDEWLLTTGVNTLRPSVSAGRLTIEQSGTPLRSHRVSVGLYSIEGKNLVRAASHRLDVCGATSAFDLPAADLVVVNDDDLTYAKMRLDAASWSTLLTHVSGLVDPLARTLCWGAAWDMVRDGEVPSGDFLELVHTGLAAEVDLTVLQRLLEQARTAAVQLGSRELRDARLTRLCDVAMGLATEAADEPERQLLCLLVAIAAASTPAQGEVLEALLDGTASMAGLAVDTDLRWALLERLAAMGRAVDLEAELLRDPSSAGALHALTCRAAQPSAAAKEAAREAIVQDASLSSYEVLALIAGFNQARQEDVLAPYSLRFFQDLDDVWAPRVVSSSWALQQVRLMYPSWDVTAATLARTDEALSRPLPEALHRVLLECRDDLVRDLTCQKADA